MNLAQQSAKVLAESQLPNAKGTLYTVPASYKTYITLVTLYNNNGTAETVTLYIKPGSTSRGWVRVTLDASGGHKHVEGKGLVLEAGDVLEGFSTTAAQVDYVICGIEEPAS